MGLEKDRGRLAKGMAADLVAMPRDPLADTNALYEIDFVMQNGKVVRHPGSH